jgi:hypothetical protein
MECAKAGCTRKAMQNSNYCFEHQPRRGTVKGRRTAKKKATKKKA